MAERLKNAQNTYAMLSTFNEVDMTNVMEMRKAFKVGLQGRVCCLRVFLCLGWACAPESTSLKSVDIQRDAQGLPRWGCAVCVACVGVWVVVTYVNSTYHFAHTHTHTYTQPTTNSPTHLPVLSRRAGRHV